jgi:anti-anti-sigma factor
MLSYIDLQDNDYVKFVLNGELVAGGMDEIRTALKKYIDDGVKKIIFDMSQVSTMDSAGVGFLAAAHNSLAKIGGVIKVTQLSEEMYNFFVSLRLNSHFNIEQRIV